MIGYRQYVTFLIAGVMLVGCGESGTEIASVEGTVTYRGQPLKRGQIIFEPQGNRSALGKIVDGEIVEVTTFETGDGAVVGNHRVALYSFVREPRGMEIVPSVIPQRYNRPDESDITVTIEPGKTNKIDIVLTD